LVCSFLPILREKFYLFSSRVLATKYLILNGFKLDTKKTFFIRHTLEENKHNFCFRVLATKYLILNGLKLDTKKTFFIRHTLEENKHNFCFKIDKKVHTKHHQIDQKLWKLIDLMMFGMQFFANFERKVLLIFLKGIDN
jgi:hypothetical protein